MVYRKAEEIFKSEQIKKLFPDVEKESKKVPYSELLTPPRKLLVNHADTSSSSGHASKQEMERNPVLLTVPGRMTREFAAENA